MKRVWLGLSLLVVSLVGLPWPSNAARGDDLPTYPGVDAGSDGLGDCPYVEKMRAYGECHWYHDEEYQDGNACEIVPDEPMAEETLCQENDVAEAVSDTEQAIQSPMPSAVVGPTDCWYDGETDAYYHYEFSGTTVAAAEDSMTDEESSCDAESYADVESNEDGAWEDDSYSEYEEYADSATEMDASSSIEDQSEAEFTEDSEEVMESTTDVAETTTPSAETPATWPSREYDYKYGGSPYGYESYEPAYVEPTYSEPGYSEPVQAWEDADVEVVEGEDDEAVPPAPSSDLVEFDSDIILSLARTLDRVGSTLRSLSQYLTEMATAETAGHHGETLHR